MTIEEWADAQFSLASGYLSGRAGAERRRIKLRWWSVPNRHRRAGAGKVTILWSMARGNTLGDRDVHVAVYEQDAAPGAAPLLVFVAQEGSGLVDRQGRMLGTAVGRLEPAGALLVETSRGTVMPASVPAAPDDEAPAWSETDLPAPAPVEAIADDGAGTGPGGRVSRWRRRSRRSGRTPPPGGDGGGR